MKELIEKKRNFESNYYRYIITCVLLCFVCFGCATIPEETIPSNVARRFLSFRQIYNGMSRAEVESVLGDQIVVGYELVDKESGQYKPVTVKNPYKQEVVKKGSERYEVVYYLKCIIKQDDKITDDELMPLIFQYDSLIGKGWIFLKQKVKK